MHFTTVPVFATSLTLVLLAFTFFCHFYFLAFHFLLILFFSFLILTDIKWHQTLLGMWVEGIYYTCSKTSLTENAFH